MFYTNIETKTCFNLWCTYDQIYIKVTFKKILLHCGDLYSTSTVVDLPTL